VELLRLNYVADCQLLSVSFQIRSLMHRGIHCSGQYAPDLTEPPPIPLPIGVFFVYSRRDSNPQSPPYEGGALSIRPHELLFTSDVQKAYLSIYRSLAPPRISALVIVKMY
jgi:hypothetical protein